MIILILCIFLLFFAIAGNFGNAVCYTLFFVPAAAIAVIIHVINPDFWPFVGAALVLAATVYGGLLLWYGAFPPKKRSA